MAHIMNQKLKVIIIVSCAIFMNRNAFISCSDASSENLRHVSVCISFLLERIDIRLNIGKIDAFILTLKNSLDCLHNPSLTLDTCWLECFVFYIGFLNPFKFGIQFSKDVWFTFDLLLLVLITGGVLEVELLQIKLLDWPYFLSFHCNLVSRLLLCLRFLKWCTIS